MNNVISAEQARKITGGRTPLVPVEYEAAVKALRACLTIDEAKYWSDKADALEAWARIHRHDQAGIESRRVKLYAYRRMGELAHELRPQTYKPNGAANPGPVSLLVQSGLRPSQATQASRISKIQQKKFTAQLNLPKPPTPPKLLKSLQAGSESWLLIANHSCGPMVFRSFCRSNDPHALARSLTGDEAKKAREIALESAEWLDAFEQALPKTPRG